MALLKNNAVGTAIPFNSNQNVYPKEYQAATGTAASYNPATAKSSSYNPSSMNASSYKPQTGTAEYYKPQTGNAASYSAKTGNSSSYAAKTGEASSYDATTYKADERGVNDNMVVENRLNNLIDKNNDYMKRASTKGLQLANSRGLLNTDFAVSSAYGSALDAALPIAQQDAQTYKDQQLANQQYSNTALRDNASFQNEADRFNAGNEQQMTIANMNAENNAAQFNAGNEQQMTLANLDAENNASQFNAGSQQQMNLANMDAYNSAEQFNAGNRQQMNMANMDAQNTAGQFNAANVQQANMANMDAYNEAGRFNAANEQQTNLANADSINQANQFNASSSQNMALANMDALNRASEFNATTAFNQWSQESQQQHAVVMENLSTENKSKLISTEMEYKALMENNKNASDAYREAIAQMGNVLNNSGMKADQQQAAVSNIEEQLSKFLDFNSTFMGFGGDVTPANAAAQSYENFKEQELQEAREAKQQEIDKRNQAITDINSQVRDLTNRLLQYGKPTNR